jgi:hypothetical protein
MASPAIGQSCQTAPGALTLTLGDGTKAYRLRSLEVLWDLPEEAQITVDCVPVSVTPQNEANLLGFANVKSTYDLSGVTGKTITIQVTQAGRYRFPIIADVKAIGALVQ